MFNETDLTNSEMEFNFRLAKFGVTSLLNQESIVKKWNINI
jgi:hypothetical protein